MFIRENASENIVWKWRPFYPGGGGGGRGGGGGGGGGGQWQSLCTARNAEPKTTGKCLSVGLCGETVKQCRTMTYGRGRSLAKWFARFMIIFFGDYLRKSENICSFSDIYLHWDGTSSCKRSSYKTRTRLSYTESIPCRAADVLATERPRAPVAMVLTFLSKYPNLSPGEGLNTEILAPSVYVRAFLCTETHFTNMDWV